MKKLSLAMLMLLTFGLVFTSCKEQDADLTVDDFKDTEWMIGTWEVKTEVDSKIEGADEATKKLVERSLPKAETREMVIDKSNVDMYAANFKAQLAFVGKEYEVSRMKMGMKMKTSVKINKKKTKITETTDANGELDLVGKKVSLTYSVNRTYTKK